MKSQSDSQMALPPMEVHRSDKGGESPSPKSGRPRDLPEITLEMAKAQLGRAFGKSIEGASLKEFGDPSQVGRVRDGGVPEPLARAWQRPDTRRAFVLALAEASGLFDVRFTIDERKSA